MAGVAARSERGAAGGLKVRLQADPTYLVRGDACVAPTMGLMTDVKSTSIKVLLVQAVVLAGLWLLQQAFL